jgi:hypothetical protein
VAERFYLVVWGRGESIWFRAEKWVGFLLKVFLYLAAFVVG